MLAEHTRPSAYKQPCDYKTPFLHVSLIGAAMFPSSFPFFYFAVAGETFLFRGFSFLCYALLYFSLCAYFGENVHHEHLLAGKNALKTVVFPAIPKKKEE